MIIEILSWMAIFGMLFLWYKYLTNKNYDE